MVGTAAGSLAPTSGPERLAQESSLAVEAGTPTLRSSSSAVGLGFLLIVSGTVLSIAGTDLLLPAVPSLPKSLGGTPAEAQFVLAAFVAGIGCGLLLFGELGARIDPRKVLVGSLAAYGLVSLAAAFAPTLHGLILLRLTQGLAGAAPAVFAPAFIRALFPPSRAVRAIGLLGSVEALVPALAPIAGVWLLGRFGWQASFIVTGVLALMLACLLRGAAPHLPRIAFRERTSSYGALLGNPVFLRYALSQALALGALLVFVFGAPAVIIGSMRGQLSDFIALQVAGIAFFILAANLTGRLSERVGPERLIMGGTLLSAAGTLALFAYALWGDGKPAMLIPPSIVVNIGFGLRGPPGFMQALLAAGGDDARGAALVALAVLATAAGGTAVAAPSIAFGLLGLAGVACAISLGAVLCLLLLPRADQHHEVLP